MSGGGSPVALAAQALRLRAWALAALADGMPDQAPPADPPAWRLFLRVEACAAPLRNALRAAGVPAGAGEAVLDQAATAESQRVLSARMQVAWIDRAAAREGWRIAVLKGGVALQAARPLDVADLDLLVDPGQAPALLQALRTAGYAAHGEDRPAPGPRDHHYAPRYAPGAIPVEVHFRIGELGGDPALLAAAVPLEGARALLRLAPADHLRHLLLHAVAHHPARRGRLRDLLLIADAVRALDGAGVAAVGGSLAAHPFAAQLNQTLGAARALAQGRAPADRWRRLSGASYVAAASGWIARLPRGAQAELATCMYAAVGCAEDRRRAWARAWSPASSPSELSAFGWLERRSPRAGKAVRGALRVARYAAAAAAALPLAGAAGAAERRARR